MPPRKQDFPCLKCNAHVKKNDHAIQCTLCDIWVHQKCVVPEMSMETFNLLVAQVKQNGGTFWACISCRSFKAKLDKRLTLLERKVEDIDETVKGHDTSIKDLEKEVKELKKNTSKATNAAEIQTVKDDASDAVLTELEEREKRKANIIVHGIEESGAEVTDGRIRKSADLVKLQSLADSLNLEIQLSTSLRYSKRLGEKSDTSTKPRPLMLSFKNVNDKTSLLENSAKLKELEEWKSVSLVQDLTKKQRQHEQSLRAKCDAKNEERSEEEAKNWEWKVVGRRGERRVVKRDLEPQEEE